MFCAVKKISSNLAGTVMRNYRTQNKLDWLDLDNFFLIKNDAKI